jgi:hypothetical protein
MKQKEREYWGTGTIQNKAIENGITEEMMSEPQLEGANLVSLSNFTGTVLPAKCRQGRRP